MMTTTVAGASTWQELDRGLRNDAARLRTGIRLEAKRLATAQRHTIDIHLALAFIGVADITTDTTNDRSTT